VIQKDRPVRDPAKQVEPEITSFFGKSCIDFHGGRFEVMLSRKETEVSRPVRPELSQRSIEIVTAQHNDYTGPEKLISRARIRRESPIKILKGALT
jgi:hypothetical protein